jgi:hypothetical protein
MDQQRRAGARTRLSVDHDKRTEAKTLESILKVSSCLHATKPARRLLDRSDPSRIHAKLSRNNGTHATNRVA